jgi:hypothetical protein
VELDDLFSALVVAATLVGAGALLLWTGMAISNRKDKGPP